MKIKHLALAVTLAMGVSTMAYADTSSAIRGNVVTPSGQVATNARVEILHVPSGTRSVAVSNESGAFSSSGLRVGGPYTVTITSAEGAKTYENIFISLGESFRLNAQLEATQVERISVTGSTITTGNNTGSSSYFNADDIANAPSFTRDIKDIVRNNPLAVLSSKDGELSVAGTNPRFNSISVDGIAQNDDFGLNANGYPTTRSPISLEAIDQVTIDVSPFNAKDSGFQGAKINAVTKSGANELFGSVFYETQNDKLAGTPQNGMNEIPLDFDETTYGATLGGAFIKDKLFFFASYEYFEAETFAEWGPAGSGAPNQTQATNEQYLAVQEIARTVYGVDAGVWDASPVTDDEKLLLKLDWNINYDHRAALTYQYTKGNRTSNASNFAGELRFSSHWYDRVEELNNYAFKLYSDWTPDFSTQFSLTYIDNPTIQASYGDFGDVTIFTPTGNIALGSDLSRHSNELKKESLIMAFDADYLVGDHSINFGYQYKSLDIYNLFLQRTKGEYQFNSIEDFANQQASFLRYQNATSLNPVDAAAAFTRDEHAVYIHDEWNISPELVLDIGLRYEMLASSDTPTYNPQAEERTGFSNTENLDGTGILLPRFGFTWDAADDLVVRGGVGRFSGGQPTVWVSNSYSNPGVGIGEVTLRSGPDLANIRIDQIPQNVLDTVANSTRFASTNFTDPNFKLPSDWRFQLAADYRFDLPYVGDNILWTTEFMYKKGENTAFWKDASLIGDEDGTTADGGRIIYDDEDGSTYDLMLTNADKDGESKIFSTVLFKKWDNGITLTTSYTNQDITDSHTSTSSTATSNYGFNTTINRNEAIVGRSTFETEHRFVVNFGYETELFAGYKTNVNMFFERRSGKPITYYADGNRVGDLGDPYGLLSPGIFTDSFLPYIPTQGDTNVRFASPEAEATFFNTINALGLSQYAGGYLPKGVNTTPWVTTLDLSIRQEIPGFMEGHKGLVYVTVDNFLNLLDSSKGKVYGSDFGTVELVEFTIDPATRQYVYGNPSTNTRNWDTFYTQDSTWRLKVGVSYRF
ncbi:TonB-dependent receptor [Arsukibacterium indicum]|uniref:TonB-dependent receptor n=1 Tax=Arsukibacterium indicum TaxID=2848612 RepID=A0ABS6MLH6_9GAMM|nr:TonB-dependent receptor [Arsukibacterium indicum]MBV2129665.1 TonB-dependent receptor [Arsukibacterium indicum]